MTSANSPMLKAYYESKAKHPDAIILMRVADFYEVLAEDAVTCGEVLGITVTSRKFGNRHLALAGFPAHALDFYLPKLVRAKYRVGICESTETN